MYAFPFMFANRYLEYQNILWDQTGSLNILSSQSVRLNYRCQPTGNSNPRESLWLKACKWSFKAYLLFCIICSPTKLSICVFLALHCLWCFVMTIFSFMFIKYFGNSGEFHLLYKNLVYGGCLFRSIRSVVYQSIWEFLNWYQNCLNRVEFFCLVTALFIHQFII